MIVLKRKVEHAGGASQLKLRRGEDDLSGLGVGTVYVAMFDEMPEGTAIFKCSKQPPKGATFVDYEGLPTDHYLWLTGKAGEMLRGELPVAHQMPTRETNALAPSRR